VRPPGVLAWRKLEEGSASGGAENGRDLEDLIDEICANIGASDKVSLAQIMQAVGTRAYGPLLLVPGLIALAPTGAIPGMSIVTGTIIVVVALQLLIGLNKPWIPKRALEFSFSRDTLVSAIERGRPYARRIDAFLKPSLTQVTGFPATRIIAIVAIALALSMYPLALVPFAVAIPSSAMVLFALGLTARDKLIIAGFILAGVALALMLYTA
jgi:hypothetical protein